MPDHPNHPLLPAGYNSWEINGDEYNGAGVNEPVWPDFMDTFEGLSIMVLTPPMVAAFNDCPDFVVPAANNNIVVRPEPRTLVVRGSG